MDGKWAWQIVGVIYQAGLIWSLVKNHNRRETAVNLRTTKTDHSTSVINPSKINRYNGEHIRFDAFGRNWTWETWISRVNREP